MNYSAIVLSAIVAFLLGFLLHGPILGGLWMKLANIHPTGKEKLSDMYPQMFSNFLANLVTAFVLAGALWIADSSAVIGGMTWYKGIICAAWLWLGFNVTSSSMEVIWMGRNYKLWLFECGCSLVVLSAMGAIIGGWN